VSFGGEHRLLAVDEEVALSPGRQDDATPLEGEGAQELEQTEPRGAHVAFFFSAPFAPFFNMGTTGGGGPLVDALPFDLAPASIVGGAGRDATAFTEGGGGGGAGFFTSAGFDGTRAGSALFVGAGLAAGASR
jgi:hypothetical protein